LSQQQQLTSHWRHEASETGYCVETGLKTVSFHFDNGTMEPTASGCWYRRTGPPCTAQARTGSCGWKAQFDTSRAESSKLFGEITNSADMAATKHASQTTTTIQLSDFQFVFDSLVLWVGVINSRLSHPCKTSPLYQRPSTKKLISTTDNRRMLFDGAQQFCCVII
jgi:hypothetical protein